MTIPGLLILNVLVGASVAFASRIQIRTLQRPVFSTRYFNALLLIEGMILLPIGIYFYTFYPDWSWMYLTDTSTTSVAVGVMAQVAYPVAAVMGYLVAYYSARGNSDWVTIMFMIFMAIGFFGLFLVASDKLLWIGTYEQFHRNVGLRPFASTSMLASTLLAASGLLVCWFYLVYRFLQEGRLSLRAF